MFCKKIMYADLFCSLNAWSQIRMWGFGTEWGSVLQMVDLHRRCLLPRDQQLSQWELKFCHWFGKTSQQFAKIEPRAPIKVKIYEGWRYPNNQQSQPQPFAFRARQKMPHFWLIHRKAQSCSAGAQDHGMSLAVSCCPWLSLGLNWVALGPLRCEVPCPPVTGVARASQPSM